MNKLAAFPGVVLLTLVAAISCNDDDSDVAGSRGSLAALDIDAPDSVHSGVEFGVEVDATNIGISNIRNARASITFDAPLSVLSVDASPGTSAAISGNLVAWDLGTLDSNTRSRLHLRVMGTLEPGEGNRTARIRAELTGQGISAGEAVATDFVTISP
jgi:hypothetical protein